MEVVSVMLRHYFLMKSHSFVHKFRNLIGTALRVQQHIRKVCDFKEYSTRSLVQYRNI